MTIELCGLLNSARQTAARNTCMTYKQIVLRVNYPPAARYGTLRRMRVRQCAVTVMM